MDVHSNHASHVRLLSDRKTGVVGRHDNYGFALSAQPGESQRRPATNTSSRLIVWIGLPAPSCSRCLCPGWSHHTPRSQKPPPDVGTKDLIPVTNAAIEALNSKLPRAVRTRGHFPNDDAAMKLLYLVLDRQADEWKRPPREWFEARTQFAVVFGDRFVTQ
jgi:hypothetical protein